jgi:hypothetical protein
MGCRACRPRLQDVPLQLGHQLAHPRVHHLVLDEGVDRQELDHPGHQRSLGGVRVRAGSLELAKQPLHGLVVRTKHDDRVVSRYANPAVERDELIQVGYTGLILAIQRFDPDQGNNFAAFARPTVPGEIRRWFRDKRRWIRLPRRLQEAKAVLRDATEELTHELLRAPTVAELATHLGIDEELVLEALTRQPVPLGLFALVGLGRAFVSADLS